MYALFPRFGKTGTPQAGSAASHNAAATSSSDLEAAIRAIVQAAVEGEEGADAILAKAEVDPALENADAKPCDVILAEMIANKESNIPDDELQGLADAFKTVSPDGARLRIEGFLSLVDDDDGEIDERDQEILTGIFRAVAPGGRSWVDFRDLVTLYALIHQGEEAMKAYAASADQDQGVRARNTSGSSGLCCLRTLHPFFGTVPAAAPGDLCGAPGSSPKQPVAGGGGGGCGG